MSDDDPRSEPGDQEHALERHGRRSDPHPVSRRRTIVCSTCNYSFQTGAVADPSCPRCLKEWLDTM